MPTSLLSVLPEVILVVVGVIIMMAEPVIAAGRSRKPLGWLAILGTARRRRSPRSISTASSASSSTAPSPRSTARFRSTTSPSSSTC